MNVQANDIVLEIGSGHNPSTRSNVLCDKFLVDDTQRGGQIVADRPIVEADGQYLPFADNSFDYVICRHVLEHVEDPELMISELERVADRGYIETPSELGERLYGWPYHDWILNQVNDKLIIQKNQLDYFPLKTINLTAWEGRKTTICLSSLLLSFLIYQT